MPAIFTRLVDAAQGKAPLSASRSPLWPAARAAWLMLHPTCAACGGRKKLQVHHKLPFHMHPALELDPSNFVTLCEGRGFMKCHLAIGHLGNYKSFNPGVTDMAAAVLAALMHRPAPEYTP